MHFSFIGTTKEPIKIKGEPCIGTICIFQYIKKNKRLWQQTKQMLSQPMKK